MLLCDYQHFTAGIGGRMHGSLSSNAPAVTPRWATARERVVLFAAAAVLLVVCDIAFHLIGEGFTVPWWYFLADAWIFVGSIVATFAMARGWTDFWLCWIAVDVVGVPELRHCQPYPSAACTRLRLFGGPGILRMAAIAADGANRTWNLTNAAGGDQPDVRHYRARNRRDCPLAALLSWLMTRTARTRAISSLPRRR